MVEITRRHVDNVAGTVGIEDDATEHDYVKFSLLCLRVGPFRSLDCIYTKLASSVPAAIINFSFWTGEGEKKNKKKKEQKKEEVAEKSASTPAGKAATAL